MGQAAHDTAQQYGWPLIADRLLDIFESMIYKRQINYRVAPK
jgi:hypothetical protein